MNKLSELPKETLVMSDNGDYVITAGELVKEYETQKVTFSEYMPTPFPSVYKWFIAKEERWEPDAKAMLELYIDSSYDDMYDGWDEQAWEVVEPHINKVQQVLEEAFNTDYATKQYTQGQEIDIDVESKRTPMSKHLLEQVNEWRSTLELKDVGDMFWNDSVFSITLRMDIQGYKQLAKDIDTYLIRQGYSEEGMMEMQGREFHELLERGEY